MEKTPEIKKNQGAFVLSTRTLLNLAQAELAHQMGVTERTVRRWENEETPMPDSAYKHMEALRVLRQVRAVADRR